MIDQALNWGVSLIRAVQGAIKSPAMTVIMNVLTFMGTEWFFILVFPFIYWCVDRRKATRIGVLFLVSTFFNLWIKDLCRQPRPYNLDPSVGLSSESSYGFPSGHAQGAVVFWGSAAQFFRSPWGAIVALVMILLISFSRIYLGVHFPTDVFGGWLLGLIFLALDYFFGEKISRVLRRAHPRLRAALVSLVALAMLAVHRNETAIPGLFFGAALGFAFVPETVPFDAKGTALQKVLRMLLGLGITAGIYLGLKAVFPKQGSELYDLFHFLRYALLGAWVSIGAPWFFIKIGISTKEAKEAA